MTKRQQENYRTDELTARLLDMLIKETGDTKAALHRQAIAYYANYVLGQDAVQNVVMELLFNSALPNKKS